MLKTRLINNAEASEKFKWLATGFKDIPRGGGASVAFNSEIGPPYKTLPDSRYYVTYDVIKISEFVPEKHPNYLLSTREYTNDLLLTKAILLPNALGISFVRIFNKSSNEVKIEAHLWLKNALEEQIIPLALEKKIYSLQALAKSERGEKVFCKLKELEIKGVASFDIINNNHGASVLIRLRSEDVA